MRRQHEEGENVTSSIPGLMQRCPNEYVKLLKEPVWCRLHAVLGRGGDRIMMNMLLDCPIFLPVVGDRSNYYQISGHPISDQKLPQNPLDVAVQNPTAAVKRPTPSALNKCHRTPSAITFVRSRMLYAKAALNAKGGVRFGMRHIRPYHISNCINKN